MSKRRKRPHSLLQVEQLEARDLLSASPIPDARITVVPNDASFGSQYALNNTGANGNKADADIDAPDAWNVLTGSLETVVAVVDTGIDYRHQDLYKNIWINQGEIPSAIRSRLIDTDGDRLITGWDLDDPRNQGAGKITDLNANGRIDGGDLLKPLAQGGWANGKSDDGDKYVDDLIGWDFLNNDNDPLDDNGHGTHVAGIVGAIGNNGIGITGVNWRVQMMALKFMGANGSGSVAGAIKAIDYASSHGAFASNHSWSMGNYLHQPLHDAIARAQRAGHIVVAAAGNGGSDGKSDNNDARADYPSGFNLGNIIAVAATGSSDGLATFSNYGVKTVDLEAPGLGILSTYPDDKYRSLGGTSMATPHVTGAVALVHSLHPDWTVSQVIQQILSTTDPNAALQGRSVTGGRLNLARAVGADRHDLVGPRIVEMSPNASGPDAVSSLRVTFSESIDLATFSADDVTLAGPNGPIGVSRITPVLGSGNAQFDLTFPSQRTFGTYRIALGPDIQDASGNGLDQDRDGIGGEATQDRASGNFTIAREYVYNLPQPGNISDNASTRFAVTVDRDIAIADVKVALVLTHAQLSNLRIHLRGPDGTDVLLTDRGATGTSLTWTTFADDAAKTLAQGATPYHDGFRPDGRLSDFVGKTASGTWELWIEDLVAGQTGRLYQFRLMIEAGPVRVRMTSVTDEESGTRFAFPHEAREEVRAGFVLDVGRSREPRSGEAAVPEVFRDESLLSPEWQDQESRPQREMPYWLWSGSESGAATTIEQLMDFFSDRNGSGQGS